jgi:predicted NAD/FAD-dependent oxidoreductase
MAIITSRLQSTSLVVSTSTHLRVYRRLPALATALARNSSQLLSGTGTLISSVAFITRRSMVATTASMSGGPPTSPTSPFRIAIVGGGITGAVAAAELSRWSKRSTVDDSALGNGAGAHVVLFDQGRRGPGGRASHRSVDPATGQVLMENDGDNVDDKKNQTLEFDHGCQFFRADCQQMRQLTATWCANGWAAPWKARFGSLPVKISESTVTDFFGVPSQTDSVHVAIGGNGGMHQLPRQILQDCQAEVRSGTRVSSVRRSADSERWEIMGVAGTAAFHDTTLDSSDQQQQEIILDTADAVLFTDISSSFDSWHRASAGVPDSFRQKLTARPRVPLFSCMIALREPIRHLLPHDAFTVNNNDNSNSDTDSTDSPLWFAACSQSKPGFANTTSAAECWTLVSTPQFAVQEIKDTTMQDPVTGEFLPQDNAYLNTVPGPALFQAFVEAVQRSLTAAAATAAGQNGGDAAVVLVPETTYMQAQRWGSGLPAPMVGLLEKNIETVCGVRYATHIPNLVYPRPSNNENDADATVRDFLADDAQGLYYAGDFCSQRCPGFEAAALSGLDVAEHMIANILN